MFPFRRPKPTKRREQTLRELAYIDLYTRRIAGHALIGDHRSRLRGTGVDFLEHMQYAPGEDYRQIDWNVLARSRQAYVKVHRAEKEIAVLLVADLSGSMEQGDERLTKKDLSIEAAATIAFSAARSNMAVGLVAGTSQVDAYLRPRKRTPQAWRILETLLDCSPASRTTDLEVLLRFAARQLKQPSMVFILSDFIGAEALLQQPLLAHMAHHHDVTPVLIEDHLERTWPVLHGYMRLQDLETGDADLVSLTRENCRKLHERMTERNHSVRRAFLRLGIIPVILGTEGSVRKVLMEYFLRRKKHHR